ncbi:Pre-mRNA-splicing factor cwc23 [Taphrina deformans PYCC 5710]|uniref:Pre-mRNA-splicing factor cwc23 n=1 Tax=Taphrina deformans (strain PYCC 5710 / ATCC 11124 / CBS 356.35 / IMI 108563 / JCM 9778 / NBRC 8474) TaxID=1097556 RepID=R4XBB2_TAPDE|nr:Pre-mRNA-splicing factor cwc23 [Taphrina deformans PYCC 5710]|eukprot:CCG83134.1 Pre-mRNA-splicing factor cwc23 [Taphrina deformans PYCC 5710]
MEDLPDFYELLHADENATEKELQKAFRQQAIKCHPDKNPTPEAAERFHLLTIAIDKLTNISTRAEYDKHRLQKREAATRRDKIDRERKIWIQELEKDELRAAQDETHSLKRKWRTTIAEEGQLAAEGARLRTELQAKRKSVHSSTLTEEAVSKDQEMASTRLSPEASKGGSTLAVRYRGDNTSDQELKMIFGAYGVVQDVVLRTTKHKTKLALISLASSTVAHKIVTLCPAELSTADVTIRQVSIVDIDRGTSEISQSQGAPASGLDIKTADTRYNNFAQDTTGVVEQTYEKSILFRMRQRQRQRGKSDLHE